MELRITEVIRRLTVAPDMLNSFLLIKIHPSSFICGGRKATNQWPVLWTPTCTGVSRHLTFLFNRFGIVVVVLVLVVTIRVNKTRKSFPNGHWIETYAIPLLRLPPRRH